MAPPISDDTNEELQKIYYTQSNYFGRDKLWQIALHNGIKVSRRQVMDWLKQQEIWQLYAPAEESKDLQSTVLNKPHDQIGIDLIDMQNYEHGNYKYIFTAIDLFSKKAYAVALKNKSNVEVNRGLREIIKKIRPKSIRSDNGSEFISDSFQTILRNNNIAQVLSTPGLPQSNGQVERFNGIIKKLINKDMMYNGTYDWKTSLQKLIDNYNNAYHSIVKDTPNNIDSSYEDDVKMVNVKQNIYNSVTSKRKALDKQKFNVGDIVRLKVQNEKTKTNWSNEIYRIVKLGKRRKLYTAPYYFIENVNTNVQINKKYYDNDLLFIPSTEVSNKMTPVEKYEISKILGFKRIDGRDMYLIKWKGYKDTTYEPYETLREDVPKMVKMFDRENNITH